MMRLVRLLSWTCVGGMVFFVSPVTSFAPSSGVVRSQPSLKNTLFPSRSVTLYASTDEESSISTSDQGILGAVGSVAALITLYSEFTLANTGCGLPAGPLGLVGLAEGLSYLGIVGIVGYSLFTKVKTGSGLPAGPAGLLGAAEGLSYLAILAGVVVIALQLTNYGYIPNAVPMEGGMCS